MVGRGGVTAMAGYLLIALGLVSGIVLALGETVAVREQILTTSVPEPSTSLALLFVLVGLSLGVAVGGVVLASIGRDERNREEDFRLDPLLYRPVRRRWLRGLLLAIPIVALLVVPALYAVPVAHSIEFTIAVGVCSVSSIGPVQPEVYPSGSIVVYHWYSSDGTVVGRVSAVGGPTLLPTGPGWLNSSAGHADGLSNGSALDFSACDPTGTPSGQTVVVRGTYYIGLL